MKKITREEFDRLYRVPLGADELWTRIQEAQCSEPMNVDQIEPVLRKVFQDKFGSSQPTTEWMDCLYKMAKAVAPLTVQQGFVPDWSKAPEGTVGCVAFFTGSVEAYWKPGATGCDNVTFIPRPAPKTRERTHQEKVHELMKKITIDPVFQSVNKELVDNLCRAAGISLTVTEE